MTSIIHLLHAPDVKDDLQRALDTIPDWRTPPSNCWFAHEALRQRQLGTSSRFHSANFINKFAGSLHAVERMELTTELKLKEQPSSVYSLSFDASGKKLISGSGDANITIWNWATQMPMTTFNSHHQDIIFQSKFLPLTDDTRLVSSAHDGTVRLAELSSQHIFQSSRQLAKHAASAHKLAINVLSSDVFLSCGEDAVVFEIDLRMPSPNRILVVKTSNRSIPLHTINYDPSNGNRFSVSGQDSQLRIYDRRYIAHGDTNFISTYSPCQFINSRIEPDISDALYNYDGTELLIMYDTDDIYAFDLRKPASTATNYTHRYMGHKPRQTVNSGMCYFGMHGEFVATGSSCGHIFFWHHDSEKIVRMLHDGHGGLTDVFEPHPSSPVLATSGIVNGLKIWSPSKDEPVHLKAEEVQAQIKVNALLCAIHRRYPNYYDN